LRSIKKRIARHLRNQLTTNELALASAARFADDARVLSDRLRDSAAWPAGLAAVALTESGDWPVIASAS